MNILEAIERANAFVFEKTGVTGTPEFVRRIEDTGKPASWMLVYNSRLFFPGITESGASVDGGEYIVTINDKSGDVSLLDVG